ncbi:MAG: 50S ribosomal protein L11 methyltransferase, partial [Candidatus Marinimicrobia bacterium]|nr:50S ribosomal protein L11 methyltransferase [Candidatus Neomarinimicrobiota bacterium]
IEGFQPVRIGEEFWITPPWHLSRIPEGDRCIIINPANAFGTGTHESTRLILELLPDMLKSGETVLDLGCGSGILSIAALKLGASEVLAIDNDPEIRNNFMENAALNHVENIPLTICDVLQMDDYSCDLAMINIQKHVILPLLGRFNVAKGTPKRVILAGLLNEHREDVQNALELQGYEVLQTPGYGQWLAVAAIRRRSDET